MLTVNRDQLESFTLEVVVVGDRGCLSVDGDLDVSSAWLLLRHADALATRRVRSVELSAGGLSFVDSAGLRALVLVQRQFQAAGIGLHLTEVSPSLSRLFDVTGLRALFGVERRGTGDALDAARRDPDEGAPTRS